jgi:hypothetical protein
MQDDVESMSGKSQGEDFPKPMRRACDHCERCHMRIVMGKWEIGKPVKKVHT